MVAARGGAGARAACAWSVPALEPRVAGMPRPHLAFARAFHVDPSDKDQWEAFILGLPATLKRDIEYRKKLFYEVDKGARARATTRRARRPEPEPENPRPIFSLPSSLLTTRSFPGDSSRLADHDGKVSMDELQAFLEDVNLDAPTVRTLMSVADCSHDGKLCIEEFSDMIHAYLDNPRFEVD